MRSIRIASFPDENSAKKAILGMEKFLYNHEDFLKLKEKNQFELKIVPSGHYYLLVLEPFTDRKVMQKILDIVRLRHSQAYPKKLHVTENKKTLKTEPVQTQQEVIPKVVTASKKISTVATAVKKVTAEVPKEKTTKVFAWYEKYDEKNLLVIALIFFLLLVILFFLFIVYVIRNKKLQHQSTILQRVIENIKEELHSKERLMAHISHELRTPMTAISGLSHLILENELPAFQKENVQNIENSVNQAIEIINDILDVTKINAGEMRILNQEFNINSVLEHVLNTVYIQAKNNNVSLNLDVNDNVPVHLISDSLRLGQVLINLLSNAIKFSKNGEVNLYISKKETFVDGVRLEFKVADTGIGMSKEELSKIFTPYTQADATINREFGGTGLGLVISKELIENMKGKIKVHSQKGLGTTFVFTIVAKIKDIDNKRKYRLPSDDLLNKNILIAESSNKNVIALMRAFRYFKYKTHVVPLLSESFAQESTNFDIVVINQMDLTSQAIKKLQKMHFNNRTKTKIILISERYAMLDKEILQELDIAGFLKIPFTQQSVLNVLSEIYGMQKTKDISKTNVIKEKLSQMKGKKILVAEDNILNHKVLSGLMAKTGIELSFVMNGQEVVDLLKKGLQFDLVLMDIEMPIIDGYDATKEIRKHQEYNNMPILGLSANVGDDAIDKAFSSGMQGYITKPIVVDVFYKKVYDALAHEIKRAPNMISETSKENAVELSIVMGLGRCNNDKKLYKSVLEDFKNIYTSSSATLKELCKKGNFKEAKKVTMDIKDVSLTIGAYRLFENLDTLQHEIEYGVKGNWEDTLVEYTEILQELLAEIDAYLDDK